MSEEKKIAYVLPVFIINIYRQLKKYVAIE